MIFVAFNVNKPPLDNPKMREAIDLAIDRPAITDKLLRGLGKPTGIMVPPMNIGYDPSFKPAPYDPQKAKKLVAEAGYDGTPISIQYPNNNIVMANEVVQAIAGYMTAAGLKVDIKPLEFTAFFPLWLQSKLDSTYFFAFGSSQYHAETVLTTMYEQGSHAYKVDMEIDALLKKQRTITDPAEQTKVIAAALPQEQREPLSPAALRRDAGLRRKEGRRLLALAGRFRAPLRLQRGWIQENRAKFGQGSCALRWCAARVAPGFVGSRPDLEDLMPTVGSKPRHRQGNMSRLGVRYESCRDLGGKQAHHN